MTTKELKAGDVITFVPPFKRTIHRFLIIDVKPIDNGLKVTYITEYGIVMTRMSNPDNQWYRWEWVCRV